jgi:hypothetical protein
MIGRSPDRSQLPLQPREGFHDLVAAVGFDDLEGQRSAGTESDWEEIRLQLAAGICSLDRGDVIDRKGTEEPLRFPRHA